MKAGSRYSYPRRMIIDGHVNLVSAFLPDTDEYLVRIGPDEYKAYKVNTSEVRDLTSITLEELAGMAKLNIKDLITIIKSKGYENVRPKY